MIILIDTETTGLPRDPWARVVELAAIALTDEGRELAAFETLIRQECPAAAYQALRVNNLTREQIAAAPSVAEVRERWIEWLSPFSGVALMTSFNVEFDRTMLRRDRLAPKDDRWGPCVMLESMAAMEAAEALEWMEWKQAYKWPKLAEAAAFFKVPVIGDAHRALTDARTAAGIWRALRTHRPNV